MVDINVNVWCNLFDSAVKIAAFIVFEKLKENRKYPESRVTQEGNYRC